jgi:hypothetical protein
MVNALGIKDLMLGSRSEELSAARLKKGIENILQASALHRNVMPVTVGGSGLISCQHQLRDPGVHAPPWHSWGSKAVPA